MAEFELKSSQFRRERAESWSELEQLIDRVERTGPRGLAADELSRLPSLYRSAVSSLSVARAISLDKSLLGYLENLVGRAYLSVYSSKRSAGEAVLQFVLRSFPRTVRRYGLYLLGSVGILLLGLLCGMLLTLNDEDWYYGLVPAAMAQGRTPASTSEELRLVLYPEDKQHPTAMLNVFASFLFTHNAKIGIIAFALGFAAAAPTVFLLFYNGLVLGAMGALYQSRGLGPDFWAWVLPHGVTELLAVCLCGMAGLALGMSLVFPGRRTRLDSLACRGREVALIVLGAVFLFFVAALIEGFFRQLVQAPAARWLMAASTLMLWIVYFGWVGRRD